MRTVRARLGLSQQQVADEIGQSATTVSDYELGYSEPKAAWLWRFADRYGIPHSWLVTGRLSAEEKAAAAMTTTAMPESPAPVLRFVPYRCGKCGDEVQEGQNWCPNCRSDLDWGE